MSAFLWAKIIVFEIGIRWIYIEKHLLCVIQPSALGRFLFIFGCIDCLVGRMAISYNTNRAIISLLKLLFLLGFCTDEIFGRANGAPPAACSNNLTPAHGYNPQSGTNPYLITLSTMVYSGDSTGTQVITGEWKRLDLGISFSDKNDRNSVSRLMNFMNF